jgi:hypothetical protein
VVPREAGAVQVALVHLRLEARGGEQRGDVAAEVAAAGDADPAGLQARLLGAYARVGIGAQEIGVYYPHRMAPAPEARLSDLGRSLRPFRREIQGDCLHQEFGSHCDELCASSAYGFEVTAG